MGMDLLDVVAGAWINVRPARRRRPIFRRPMSRGLRYVIQYVGVKGLARPAGRQVIIVTTAGTANLAALEPATQLMESAKAGDSVAKAQVLELASKAEAGDALAKQTMGVLDVAAAGLKAAEPAESAVPQEEKAETPPATEPKKTDGPAVEAGAGKTTVIRKDGARKTFNTLAAAKAWVAKNPGSRVVSATRTPGQRPGQARSAAQAANRQGSAPQRPMPQRRPGSQLVNQQQIAQSMQNMTPQQQQVFQQNLLQQQQANIQQGMLQQQYDPYGYPTGYPQQSGYPAGYQTSYPQQAGYPAGYAIPMQTGFPSGYVQQEQFMDVPPDDLGGDEGGGGSEPGDVEINDEAGE